MNDRRGLVVAIADSSPRFQTLPVVYTHYSQAVRYVGSERKQMGFVLVHPTPGTDVERSKNSKLLFHRRL